MISMNGHQATAIREGKRVSSVASTTLNTAVLAPIPSARLSAARRRLTAAASASGWRAEGPDVPPQGTDSCRSRCELYL